jgi:hypothetical protein
MRRLVAVVALVCFGGCAASATIVRTDGPDSEAPIERSDAGALYVRARNGRIYRIPRESINGIDHPGNVEILVGALMVGAIGALATAIVASDNPYDRDSLIGLLAGYGVPGLALMTWGLMKYVPSVQAARAFQSPALASPGTSPAVVPSLPVPAPSPVLPTQPAPSRTTPLPPPEEPVPEVVPDAT